MKRRINLQSMLLALAAIFATAILTTGVFYNLLKNEIIRDLETYTGIMVEADAWALITDPVHADKESIHDGANQLRITLIAADGTVLFDSSLNAEDMSNHAERPEVKEAIGNGEGYAIRTSETMGKSLVYYAKSLDNGNILRVSREVSSMISVLVSVFPLITVVCIILFVICIILSSLLTKNIVKPIENLAENLDASESARVYKELVPFVTTIRRQHDDIMRNANMRQEFTANVSHELKTPLTSISGYSELIESGMATEDDVVRFATEIHKSCNRLLSLINDIIRLSELDQTSSEEIFENVDLYEVAVNCVNTLQVNAEKHNVQIRLAGGKMNVRANQMMMEELVYNLCDNAIRYNNPGGTVDVSVVRCEEGVELSVKDTGIGIPKEHQDRIFERFYRVDKSRSKSTGGTGLGLAIVKHIVARHEHASIELESEFGKGTTIRVVFREE